MKEVMAQQSGYSRNEGPVEKYGKAVENTKQRKHRRRKDTKSKEGMSHRDEFRPCSRVLSGGRTSKETNWKSRTEEKYRFNQQQGTFLLRLDEKE